MSPETKAHKIAEFLLDYVSEVAYFIDTNTDALRGKPVIQMILIVSEEVFEAFLFDIEPSDNYLEKIKKVANFFEIPIDSLNSILFRVQISSYWYFPVNITLIPENWKEDQRTLNHIRNIESQYFIDEVKKSIVLTRRTYGANIEPVKE